MLITRVAVVEKYHDKPATIKEQWLDEISVTAEGTVLPRAHYANEPKAEFSKKDLMTILKVNYSELFYRKAEDTLRKHPKTIDKFSAETDTKNFVNLDLEIRKEALEL